MPIKVAVYNIKGEKVGDINLSEAIFGLPANNALLHQVYVSQAANKRIVIAHTKDRGERAGSGKKPWKQKGTGNARVGSARTPVWRKGGVVFGPRKERNFKKKINKKMARKAVQVALSEKARSNNLLVLDEMKLKEKKSKEFFRILENLKIKGSALVGFSDKEKEYSLASRNIKNVHNILVNNLNVSDLLNRKYLLLSKESIKFLENKYK
ncbi:MAG: 50S ribosomal protein L4 [Candidatus Moranbacteria bacterium RIFCSPHIGHO2_02_FULL_40_12b]|nr:MAG: 50S ribosomal protein L4 [Candidatus Moranbacteria bacterium RIFCSPHIGHO2_02_FULL_40_12b]OGI22921.1 MAG: 50S ribosomal protein L4 [Candidatus Moranbacteria bacterium RIFCSPHIGHO2_12_FULL_40_10]